MKEEESFAATVNRNQDASPPFYGVNDANPPIGLTYFPWEWAIDRF